MLSFITSGAYELDKWLKEHFGRPYTILLGASLILGILAAGRNIEHNFGSTTDVAGSLFSVAVQIVLLINQLGQLHEYRQVIRGRREARKARKAERKARPGE